MGPFHRCRWFTRGWTLLELIAPRGLRFFDCEWNFLGTKRGLADEISDITHIPLACLEGSTMPNDYPIATRMDWVSSRQTARIEDMAYCLMGLFHVKMEIKYGEGEKAFTRLQEKIMQQTTDQSLLAWKPFPKSRRGLRTSLSPCPILAGSPVFFYNPPSSFLADPELTNAKHQRITRTEVGLVFWAPVFETLSDSLVFAALNYETPSDRWIPLWKTERGTYYRVDFPAMTLYSLGMMTTPQVEATKICLEEPAAIPNTSSCSANPLETENLATKEHPQQTEEVPFEVLAVFPSGKQISSGSAIHMYPFASPNEVKRFGTLRLSHRGNRYFYGILVFEINSRFQDKAIAIFFAAISWSVRRLRAWTCRVLLDVNDTSSTNLEKVSTSELAKICSDEQVPSLCPAVESSIWRRRDQNGKTVVELVECGQIIIAKIMFEAPTQADILLASIGQAFKKSKEKTNSVPTISRASLS